MANDRAKHGFIYLWLDVRYKRYYVGCHWGNENDGYICSSNWMRDSFKRRPSDFRRKILKTNIQTRTELYEEEQRWLNMIKPEEIKHRYYNLNIRNNEIWHKYDESIKTIGQKISISKKGKNTGPRHPNVGKRISEAKKKAFAEGRTIVTEEWRKKNGDARRGIPQSEESNKKRSESHKKHWAEHEHHLKGSKHSAESRLKNSIAHVGMKRSDETKQKLSESNSKKYIISFMDEREDIIICGLKKYSADNMIPYVTLYKASQNGTKIKKHKIASISVEE